MEKKIHWKRKVTSRKLWVSICGFVSMLVVAMGGTESDAAQVSAIIMAGATVVGYVIGEGLADASNNLSEDELIQNTDLTNIRD